MSKIHTTVRVGVDGSLTLPAFFMRGMGYEPGEEVPITTPANQYICDCDANRLLVTRTYATVLSIKADILSEYKLL